MQGGRVKGLKEWGLCRCLGSRRVVRCGETKCVMGSEGQEAGGYRGLRDFIFEGSPNVAAAVQKAHNRQDVLAMLPGLCWWWEAAIR